MRREPVDILPLPADGAPMVEIRGLSSVFKLPERKVVIHKDLNLSLIHI